MTMNIDLNSDLGEGFGPWSMGDDAAILDVVTSANIACGGHASDPETMFKTLTMAKDLGVNVGAHPGYDDRAGFGRRIIPMSIPEIGRMVAAQIGSLMAIASLVGVKVNYVKPHGALGNLAARDADVAIEITKTISKIDKDLAVLAISGMQLEHAARQTGLQVFSEIFADRGYLSSGQLVPRGQTGAMIEDADQASERLVKFMKTGLMPVIDGDPITLNAQSICVHGDGPTALSMAQKIKSCLIEEDILITPFLGQ